MLIRYLFEGISKTKSNLRRDLQFAFLKNRIWHKQFGSYVKFLNYTVQITDGPNFMIQYKDIFINKIYHFNAVSKSPFIIDGGSNIGMSIIYFKHIFPDAKIIGFEPDSQIFALLEENITKNNLKNITLINSALGKTASKVPFISNRGSGGRLENDSRSMTIKSVCLSNYINESVDFLKLNIEGSELPVLEEIEKSGKLNNIIEIVLEYHGWSKERQKLGDILNLLDRNDYHYLVHDFDSLTCNASKPPFKIFSNTEWFCLVYAKRKE